MNKPPFQLLACWCCLLILALSLHGCATPVGVNSLTPEKANEKLTENVLSNDSLSAPTQQLLNRAGLAEQYRKDPAAAIQTLRTGIPMASKDDKLFALAELSFLYANLQADRSSYLAAAVYAYAFLFVADNGASGPNPFDPRLLTAVNLYNQGLVYGLVGAKSGTVELESATHALPSGSLTIHLDPGELRWGPFTLVDFMAASQLQVRGLRNNYRWPGIGSALVASLQHIPGEEVSSFALVPPSLKVSVTAFLRIDNPGAVLDAADLHGELALYTTQEDTEVEINGRKVPLEYQTTSALAYALEGSQMYDMELKGLLSGDLMLFKQSARFKDNVFLMSPHRPGRIPLVLVHGTASSPARWAEVLNELLNDRKLYERYQIWMFTYNTGNPILYSGGLLVHGLRNIVQQFDPEGKDEALKKMVIIGHSQGGLLTKLTTIDSGDLFWDGLFNVPVDQVKTSEETRQILRRSLFFKPLPFVRHVVFLSTPHHGSFLAKNWVTTLLQRLITLPFTLLSPLQEIFNNDPKSLKISGMKEAIPRSTDNMNPNSDFIKAFAKIPLAPQIKAHSIIAVGNPEDPPEDWDDGVVTYQSAHIEGVASELVVHSPHSSQDNPATIEEIRRILVENLQE